MKSLLIGTVWFSSLLSPIQATADTVRGVQRELVDHDLQGPSLTAANAANYAILAKTGITTTGTTEITGNIAVSPIAATAMTGFSLIADTETGTFSTSSTLVDDRVYAASYNEPTPTDLTSAVGEMETAYVYAAGCANSDEARKNIGKGTLGGNFGGAGYALTAGVYTFDKGDVSIAGEIHFKGTASDVFIIQIAGNLVQDAGYNVILDETTGEGEFAGTPLAKNIFWQVAGHVEVKAGAHMEGIILGKTHVTFITGSTLNGRVFAQTACNLQSATITQPSAA
jgi:hypothetical protein